MHSPDFTDENIAKLAELFPNCVTEKKQTEKDAKGRGKVVVTKAIDWDLLKQELSTNIVEGQQERYQLNWPGKRLNFNGLEHYHQKLTGNYHFNNFIYLDS